MKGFRILIWEPFSFLVFLAPQNTIPTEKDMLK